MVSVYIFTKCLELFCIVQLTLVFNSFVAEAMCYSEKRISDFQLFVMDPIEVFTHLIHSKNMNS